MADNPDDAGLTARQQEVLTLVREGKTPTEIGKALEISSQGVHGHLRRLAQRGLVTLEQSPSRTASTRTRRERNGSRKLNPSQALEAVHQAAREQATAVEARVAAIDVEIADLRDEKKQLGETLKQLQAHLPS